MPTLMTRFSRFAFRAGLLAGAFLVAACASAQTDAVNAPPGSYPPPALPTVENAAEITSAVLAVLDAQVDAWNRGDVREYMEGYARPDTLIMISGGTLRRGWQEVFYAYMRNYPDQEAMGTLSFEDVHVRALSPEYALAYGLWRLRRAEDEPLGLFSLLVRNLDGEWKIVHDHTSAAP